MLFNNKVNLIIQYVKFQKMSPGVIIISTTKKMNLQLIWFNKLLFIQKLWYLNTIKNVEGLC